MDSKTEDQNLFLKKPFCQNVIPLNLAFGLVHNLHQIYLSYSTWENCSTNTQ